MPIFPSFFVNKDAAAYEIEQSLRFDGNGYLSRSPGSNGNLRTNTISVWIKQSAKDAPQSLFGQGRCGPRWSVSSNVGQILHNAGVGGTNNFLYSNGRYRDPSAWYHLVIIHDTTQATESDRVRIYINGTEITFSSASYPGQNADMNFNNTEVLTIGRGNTTDTEVWLGYMAEYQFIDGSAVEPDQFAEADNNGVWRPIEYTGSYGTQGYYLKFDETATNGIGHDHSGNGNNFTASGFTTSGPGTDVMSDTPTTNFNTLNPAIRPYTASAGTEVLSNGNLTLSCSSSSVSGSAWSTMLITSGKWYWEGTLSTAGASNNTIGWCNSTEDAGRGTHVADLRTNGVCYLGDNGEKVINTTKTSYGDSFTAGDVIGAALDADADTITFYKNGVSQGDITGQSPQSDSAGWLAAVEGFNGTVWDVNFGQREFAYPPGTASATDYFNTVTYTGNGSTQSITGVGFQPDLVIAKNRDSTNSFRVVDAVRGVGIQLYTNDTIKEETVSTGLTSFDSDGFSLGSSGGINGSGIDFAAWCWKAGGSGSANNTGTINATVSANQDAGFSIITYTGGGSAGTVAHGLSSAPKVYWVKNRSSSTAYNWYVYHDDLSSAGHFLKLNSADSEIASADPFNNTAPTSSVISVGGENVVNGVDYVVYCFADVTGVSKHGTYTGTGAAGNYVELGFKPACVILKRRSGSASHWYLYDNKRGADSYVLVNSAAAETTNTSEKVLLTQNGFLLQTSAAMNTSGAPYIYMAFAENLAADADFKSLNTANLPAPEIKDGSKNFNTLLWSGDGASSRALTGVGFQPEMTWIKARNQGYSHQLFDAVRGAGGNSLQPDRNVQEGVEGTGNGYLSSFDSDGFTVDYGTNGFYSNRAGTTYVAWSWDAGGSGSSNTAGSITSTVSANPSAGFSIVSYTGTGSAATVGHGLGVAPDLIILKARNLSSSNWKVYASVLGDKYLNLNDTTAAADAGSNIWNDTAPTSTVFSIGNDYDVNNSSSTTYIAYCFAEVEGYSKFGSYTGNGSTDGPFVYCGFRPSFLLFKRSSAAEDWVITDTARRTYNQMNGGLRPNGNYVEFSDDSVAVDFTANGFKIRATDAKTNSSGSTYIFMALAENPFGGSGVSPATAR